MNTSIRRGAGLVALAVLACAPPRPPGAAPAPAEDACTLGSGAARGGDTITLALPGAIDPAHAPNPASDAERFLFRALYETLIRVDCSGRVGPALAEAWAPEDGGRRWTFVLRSDARFWDGEPVTAHDVVAAWTGHDSLAAFAPWAGPVAQAAQVMSERVVSVTLRYPSRDIPRALAHPGLAVTKAAPGLRWPIGTGRYWLDESARDPTAAPAFGDPLPVLRFRALAGGDARDLLDAGADILLTDDAGAVAYASTRGELRVEPLPWDRTYALLVPRGTWPRVARDALARDAVRTEARAAEPPYWWESASSCLAAPPPVSRLPPAASRGARRTVYLRGDGIARDLATRLVAVSDSAAVAAALSRDAFAAQLRSGAAAAYVVPLARAPLDLCHEAEALGARAPWLDLRTIVPLVDVRRRLVVRGGIRGLSLDWDGALRVR